MKIGISGKMASGKSTVAKHIQSTYGGEIHPFAEPMKMLEKIHAEVDPQLWRIEILPITDDIGAGVGMTHPAILTELDEMILEVFNKHKPMPGKKNRAFLQEIGTECVRKNFHDQAWVQYVIHKYAKKDTIVDDVRFENEALALRKAGFMLIRLEIDPEEQERRIKELYGGSFDPAAYTHPSEVELDGKDYLFDVVIQSSIRPVELVLEKVNCAIKEYQRWQQAAV